MSFESGCDKAEIDFREDGARGLEGVEQRLAHADRLRPLAWKNESLRHALPPLARFFDVSRREWHCGAARVKLRACGQKSLERSMSEKKCGCGRGHVFDRRGALAIVSGAGLALGASPAMAMATRAPVRPEDEGFMRLAIEEAAKGDFPFGAVIVRDGKVASTGRNLGITTNDPTAHGEMVAIRHFVAERPAKELEGATLYTSGEPCPMCMSAIVWCHMGRVVYAASIEQLSKRLGQIMLTSRTVAEAAPFLTVAITGGVLASEALALFDKK